LRIHQRTASAVHHVGHQADLASRALTPIGTLTTLYEFCLQPNCSDGAAPTGGLVQAADGSFYGTTSQGGTGANCSLQYGCGTIFKLTPAGTLTTLYSFCSLKNCADGKIPFGTLLHASDGNLYGTTQVGGVISNMCPDGCSTSFKITPNGSFTTIYTFCSQQECTDGASPNQTLVQGADGDLYGTTEESGPNLYGTIFRLTFAGSLTTVYNFCSQPDCADGWSPFAGLVQAADGNFYGTTFLGGGNNGCSGYGCETVFKISPSGAFAVLHAFKPPSDGIVIDAPLVQATDGNLYGATVAGAPVITVRFSGSHPAESSQLFMTFALKADVPTAVNLWADCPKPTMGISTGPRIPLDSTRAARSSCLH
jgi:uncharacterized repeat protein (TIGR03803 family)